MWYERLSCCLSSSMSCSGWNDLCSYILTWKTTVSSRPFSLHRFANGHILHQFTYCTSPSLKRSHKFGRKYQWLAQKECKLLTRTDMQHAYLYNLPNQCSEPQFRSERAGRSWKDLEGPVGFCSLSRRASRMADLISVVRSSKHQKASQIWLKEITCLRHVTARCAGSRVY